MKTSVVMFCALILCMLSLAAAKALENPPPNHPPRFKRVAGGLENLPPNHPPRFKRVAGGTPAADNKYNFVVKITRNSEKYPFCHGTIISSRWILTSGLCFNGKTPKDVLVSAGTKRTSGEIVISEVEKLIIHDDFDRKAATSDLALMKLSKELELGTSAESLKAIDLPEQNETETVGEKCFMAGYGYINETSIGKDLNEIELQIVDDKDCAEKMNTLFPVDKETMFCATGDGKRTGCILDNGSPLACKEGDKWVARGLFSWSHIKCDTSYYTVLTRLSRFVDWIKKTMKDQ